MKVVFFSAEVKGLIAAHATHQDEPMDRVILGKVCARRLLRDFAKDNHMAIVGSIHESPPMERPDAAH